MDYVYVVKTIFQENEEATPEIEIYAIYANEIDAISAAEKQMQFQVGENGTYTSYEGDECDFGFEGDIEGGHLNVEVEPYPVYGEPIGRL